MVTLFLFPVYEKIYRETYISHFFRKIVRFLPSTGQIHRFFNPYIEGYFYNGGNTMDYMRQLNGFWLFRQTTPLSHTQADLYYTILACANTARWRDYLTILNTTICILITAPTAPVHHLRP